MSAFRTISSTRRPRDPYRRVLYSHGLVLGEDDFLQEQTYFLERDRQHQRLLHGHGTLVGLALQTRVVSAARGPEIVVSRGAAINRAGQTIRVPEDQCAELEAWMLEHRAELTELFGPPPTSVLVEVILCVRECATDSVPVPGGPCRTQDEAVRPSRIADGFRLVLQPVGAQASPPGSPPTSPPIAAGPLEADVRDLRRLIESLVPVPSVDPQAQLDAILAVVRGLPDTSAPPTGALPIDPGWFDEAVSAVLRVWVTEVRPHLAFEAGLIPPPDHDASHERVDPHHCVLLGQLVIPVDATLRVSGPVEIDETRRAVLLPTEALQLEFGRGGGVVSGWFDATGAPVVPPSDPTLAVAVGGDGDYRVTFAGYSPPPAGTAPFQVRGIVTASAAGTATGSLQLVGFANDGVVVRVADAQSNPLARGFQVEISWGGGPR